jgi:hypothetical protein
MVAALAAPYVVRDTGLLMPVCQRLILPMDAVPIELVWVVIGPSHWRLVSDDDRLLLPTRRAL